MDDHHLIDARGLGKTYGSLAVLIDANFAVNNGEIRALVGSNGAGKSTLIKILTGAIAPTTGTVKVNGKDLVLGSPPEMINNGIACIYQHSNLAPAMSVLDNIFLGRQPTKRFGFLDRKRQRREAEELLQRHAIQIDLDALVSTLPTVKQKEVEILKALALNARVLLMDEPTGWLAASDVAKLHATIRTLKSKGVGIVYISHMLDEIFSVCDTVTVMRDGRIISEGKVADITRPKLVKLMVGEKLAIDSAQAGKVKRMARGTGRVRLSARSMTKRGVFSDISFDLFAGEIFCITGLIGSKRTEFLHTLFGSDKFDSGELKVDGNVISFKSPTQAINNGIGFVTEDRHREGLMLGLSISNNLVMATLSRFHNLGLLKRKEIHSATGAMITDLNIQPPDPIKPVRLLSGGNQQKVLLGKWLNLKPKILLLDEPTVGVDVGAKAEIYAILRAERDRGAAILVVSSDLEEVMTISDRIAVMACGRLVAIHDADKTSLSEIIGEIGGAAQ
ncbi:MAG: sugar ABC transporter ATP-binding protein [Aestuariivirga sp.]